MAVPFHQHSVRYLGAWQRLHFPRIMHFSGLHPAPQAQPRVTPLSHPPASQLLQDPQVLSPSNTWGFQKLPGISRSSTLTFLFLQTLQKLPGKFKNLFRKFENLTVSGFGFYLPLDLYPRDSLFLPSSSFPFKVFSAWDPLLFPPCWRTTTLFSLEEGESNQYLPQHTPS